MVWNGKANRLSVHDLRGWLTKKGRLFSRPLNVQSDARHKSHEHPVVLPHVSHFMQVPFRTSVKLPHSEHISPS
jgi:hypothetical protein